MRPDIYWWLPAGIAIALTLASMTQVHAAPVKTAEENAKWFTDPAQAVHAAAIAEAKRSAAKGVFNTCALIVGNMMDCARIMQRQDVLTMQSWTEEQWQTAAYCSIDPNVDQKTLEEWERWAQICGS